MATCEDPLSLCKINKEIFWMDDIKQLYIDNKYLNFYPKFESTRVEQLNAITRFCIYFIIISLIFNKDIKWLYFPITGIILTVVIYNINFYDKKSKEKEFNKIMDIRRKKRNDKIKKEMKELKHDDHVDTEEYPGEVDNFGLETGFIDGNNDLLINEFSGASDNELQETLLTVDEIDHYNKNTCRIPNTSNPFMNPNITDYNNGDPPAACNADDEEIKTDMKVNFSTDLFKDIDDLFDRKNSERQFYTIPNTSVPNNQTEFAKWLYKIPETCKEDQLGCLRYENIKFKR